MLPETYCVFLLIFVQFEAQGGDKLRLIQSNFKIVGQCLPSFDDFTLLKAALSFPSLLRIPLLSLFIVASKSGGMETLDGVRSFASFVVVGYGVCVLLGAPFVDRALYTLAFCTWLWILLVWLPRSRIPPHHRLQYEKEWIHWCREMNAKDQQGPSSRQKERQGSNPRTSTHAGGRGTFLQSWLAENPFHASIFRLIYLYLTALDNYGTLYPKGNSAADSTQPDAGASNSNRSSLSAAIIRDDVNKVWGIFPTIFGCWLGAVFIPLDWDVWWQRYPIPNAAMGTAFFVAYSLVQSLFGRVAKITSKEL